MENNQNFVVFDREAISYYFEFILTLDTTD